MRPRIAIANIGQSPRDDVVVELLDEAGIDAETQEFGVLDGLTDSQIDSLAPTGGSDRLVTRLRCGREVHLDRHRVAERIQAILDDVDRQSFDLAVLLCTGSFPELRCRTFLVEAGRIVDGMVSALADGRQKIGVMVPERSQARRWQNRTIGSAACIASYASPYTNQRFPEATAELRDSEFIVMHCMGYDSAMRREVSIRAKGPVLLARSVVAGTLRQLL